MSEELVTYGEVIGKITSPILIEDKQTIDLNDIGRTLFYKAYGKYIKEIPMKEWSSLKNEFKKKIFVENDEKLMQLLNDIFIYCYIKSINLNKYFKCETTN